MVTGSPLKSYTNFCENNNHILLKITPISAQGNSGDFEDGDIFPDFEAEDNKGEEDGDIFPDFEAEDNKGEEKDGGKEKDGGNEERINEILMILAPFPLAHQQTQMIKQTQMMK